MSLDLIKVEDTRSWFRKAQNDISAAELLLTKPLVDEVAFHCQQAVEKCLKGFLFWNGKPIKKIHALNILSSECSAIDATLESELKPTFLLTQYAVEYRYPGPMIHPSKSEATELISLAKSVYETITKRLPFSID